MRCKTGNKLPKREGDEPIVDRVCKLNRFIHKKISLHTIYLPMSAYQWCDLEADRLAKTVSTTL